jgi:2-keto-3-deoxy-L-rhamnonate aldolase RhmA
VRRREFITLVGGAVPERVDRGQAVGGLASRPDLMVEYIRVGARYVSTGTDLSFLLVAATERAKQIKAIKS